jgi:hypothetical protein
MKGLSRGVKELRDLVSDRLLVILALAARLEKYSSETEYYL